MNNHEKLMEILQKKPFGYSKVSAGRLADHLILNGVGELPSKSDDAVYVLAPPCQECRYADEPYTDEIHERCQACEKLAVVTVPIGEMIPDIGEAVFFSRVDAERALRKKEKQKCCMRTKVFEKGGERVVKL